MKTKLDHLKENWIISLIWSSPDAFIAFIITRSITVNVFPCIFVPIVVLIYQMSVSLNNWYNEERMDNMQEEINGLKSVIQHKE